MTGIGAIPVVKISILREEVLFGCEVNCDE